MTCMALLVLTYPAAAVFRDYFHTVQRLGFHMDPGRPKGVSNHLRELFGCLKVPDVDI